MAGITAGRLEARFEDVSGRVVGGQQQDVASLGGRTVRQGRAARDAGGQGEGHEGEAGARGSIEQGEVTLGDATGPQPAEGLVGHPIEEADSGLGSRRFLRRLLLFEGAVVVGYFALEVAADKVVHVSGFHSENPFGIMTCALKKGIGDGTVVEGCQAQVRGGWVWSDLMFVSLCSVYHREKTSEGRKQKQPPKGWGKYASIYQKAHQHPWGRGRWGVDGRARCALHDATSPQVLNALRHVRLRTN